MAPVANPPEFADRGIKPMPTGVAEPPKAAQTRALARQIARRGIKDPAGTTVYEPDEDAAFALARPWLYPTKWPVSSSVRRSSMSTPASSPRSRQRALDALDSLAAELACERKAADPGGRRRWPRRRALGPTDLQADAECAHRLLFAARDLDERGVRTRDRVHFEGMQSNLADMIGREGIEEDLLLAPGRWDLDSGSMVASSTVVAIDGGSRATLSQGELARALAVMLDNDGSLSPKRRRGLEELRAALDGRLPGLLVDDITAERDLRDELDRLLSEPADVLLRTACTAAASSRRPRCTGDRLPALWRGHDARCRPAAHRQSPQARPEAVGAVRAGVRHPRRGHSFAAQHQ